jgi:type II secretory pathway component GspD/PulD (secretin)
MIRSTAVRALLALIIVSFCSLADAQRGGRGGFGGGFGGPGGFGAMPADYLRDLLDPNFQTELGLTDEQKTKLQELQTNRPDGREEMGRLFGQMREAGEDEAARAAVQAQIQALMERNAADAEVAVKQLLQESQFTRLQQISLQRSGVRALLRPSVATELKLTEDQKKQVTALSEEFNEVRRDMFRMSEEDRNKATAEWDAKFLAVLTPDQKTQWTGKLGTPMQATAGPPFGFPGAVPGAPMGPPVPRVIRVEEVPAGAQPVMSFVAKGDGAAATPTDGQPPGLAPGTSPKTAESMSFNFKYAPWSDVLKMFAAAAGLSLDLNDVPPGTFSYFDQRSYTPMEALDVLNGYLLPKGYVLVRRDDFLVCLNIDRPIPPNLIPNITPEELPKRGKNELLTVLFPLAGVDVAAVAAEVDQIKGPQGSVVGLTSSNSLLVTDIGSNLRRIDAMLKSIAARSGPSDRTFSAYPLKNVAPLEAEQIVRSLLGLSSVAPNVSAANERSRTPSAPGVVAGLSSTVITADTRTSQLLVTATAAEHSIIRDTLQTIDVPGDGASGGDGKPYLASYAVTSGDAREVAKTLDALMPGVVVNEEGRNGRVHIMGTASQHQEAQLLIQQLDGVGGAKQVMVIPLSRMDPVSAASTLRSMFIADGTNAPTIEPDLLSRQVMVRGTQDQLAQVKTLMAQLGEDGSGQRSGENRGPVRSIPLSGRDPQELMQVIQRMWGASSDVPIRVILPRDRAPLGGVRAPNDREPRPQAEDKSGPFEPSTSRPARSGELRVLPATLQQAADEKGQNADANNQAADPNEQTTGAKDPAQATAPGSENGESQPAPESGITMTIVGDELVIGSSDPKALDQLEEMLASAMRVVPPRTTWTVFTLQSADATEVAAILAQLIPDVTVASRSSSASSGMMGSLSNFGGSLVDMAGLDNLSTSLSLKIIPEPRLNALFVSGPSEKVRDVEEMLKVLDASEWPDSLRDRVPRMIPVNHADVNEVYTIVKDVYQDFLQDPNQNNQARQGAQALAALMGGGRGGERQSQQPELRMTLSKDERTNHLIVSANDGTVREVTALVESIDKAALEARRTVRVMPLDNVSSSVLQNALGSLMPRVKISTTRSSGSSSRSSDSSSSSSSGSSGAPAAPSGGPNPDDMRRFFEQRMRERMEGGGGGPGGGGFRGFPGGGFPGGGFPGGGGDSSRDGGGRRGR